MPSFKAMTEWALKDERVKKERANALAFDDDEFDDMEDEDEDEDDADEDADDLLSTDDDDDEEDENSDFDDLPDDGKDEPAPKPKKKAKDKKAEAEDDGSPWQERLVLDKADQVEKSKFNCILIITNDRRIAPNIAYNELSGGPDAMGLLRFSKVDAPQPPIIHFGDNTCSQPAIVLNRDNVRIDAGGAFSTLTSGLRA